MDPEQQLAALERRLDVVDEHLRTLSDYLEHLEARLR